MAIVIRVLISRSTKNMQEKWQNEVGHQLCYLLPHPKYVSWQSLEFKNNCKFTFFPYLFKFRSANRLHLSNGRLTSKLQRVRCILQLERLCINCLFQEIFFNVVWISNHLVSYCKSIFYIKLWGLKTKSIGYNGLMGMT